MAEKKDKLVKKNETKKSVSAAAAAANAVAKAPLDFEAGYATGYETDAGPSTNYSKKKSKSKKKQPKSAGAGDAGYETDDGYMSVGGKSKSKTKFFKLGNKSKAQVEDLPSKEVAITPAPVRLPIAERFATTFGPNAAANVQLSSGPSQTPSTSKLPSVSLPSSERESMEMAPPPSSSKRNAVRFVNGSDSHSSTNDSIFSRGLSESSSTSPTSPSSNGHAPTSYPGRPLATSPPSLHVKTTSQSSNHDSPPGKGNRHVPNALKLSPNALTAPSVSPASESPFVVITPVDPSAPPPSESMAAKDSSGKTKARFFVKTVEDLMPKKNSNKPPQGLVISSPIPVNTGSSYVSPASANTAPPPSTFISPRRREESLMSPPTGPLPIVPKQEKNEYISKFALQQQQNQLSPTSPASRAVSPNQWSNNTVRGRESPFPARPVLPGAGAVGADRIGASPAGLESRMKVRRYRELYGLEMPADRDAGADLTERLPRQRDYSVDPVPLAAITHSGNMIISGSRRYEEDEEEVVSPTNPKRRGVAFRATLEVGFAAGDGSHYVDSAYDQEGYDQEEYEDPYEDEEIHRVADQYKPSSAVRQLEPAIGRAQSFEKLKEKFLDATAAGQLNGGIHRRSPSRPTQVVDSVYDPPSIYIEDEEYDGQLQEDASPFPEDVTDRGTMYSDTASVYTMNSRMSVLDAEKSEEARDRFLRRIDAMFDQNGRELPPRDYVPPVPSLPAALQATKTDRNGWL